MQRIMCLTAILALLTAGRASADDQADIKAVIDKAIKATGGAETIAKYKGQAFKGKGKFYGQGDGIEYTGDWAVQLPNQSRAQIDISPGGMKFTFVRVINGDKIWNKLGDQTMEVTDKDEIAEAREDGHTRSVLSLLPLVGKGFQLAPVGEVKVEGKPAIGIRVSHKGHRDINLFFDKDTGLLVKIETVVKDNMAGGKEMTQESLYSNYKEVQGMQVPFKVVVNRDGKKFIDGELTEMELKEKLDDSVFDKP